MKVENDDGPPDRDRIRCDIDERTTLKDFAAHLDIQSAVKHFITTSEGDTFGLVKIHRHAYKCECGEMVK